MAFILGLFGKERRRSSLKGLFNRDLIIGTKRLVNQMAVPEKK